MSARRDARRLVELCADGHASAAVIDALRSARDDIAVANHGQALTIEVVMGHRCRVKLGVTPAGRIVHPLGGDDPADVRVAGATEDVAAVLLGEHTLTYAQVHGLVTIRDGVDPDKLDHLRGVVARELRDVLDNRAVLIPITVAWGWRIRRMAQVPAEVTTAAVVRVGPALVAATVAVLGGITPSAALINHASPTTPAAAVATTPRAAPPATVSPPRGASVRPFAHPAGPVPPPTPAVSVNASVHRDDDGAVRTHIDGHQQTRTIPVWGETRCDTTFRAAVCGAVDALPTGGT